MQDQQWVRPKQFDLLTCLFLTIDRLLQKVWILQCCRYLSSSVDRSTAYQGFLICLGVIFWVCFEFQFVLYLFPSQRSIFLLFTYITPLYPRIFNIKFLINKLEFFLIFARGFELFLLARGFGSFLLADSSSHPYLKISLGFVSARTRSSPRRSSSSLPLRVYQSFGKCSDDGQKRRRATKPVRKDGYF